MEVNKSAVTILYVLIIFVSVPVVNAVLLIIVFYTLKILTLMEFLMGIG